MEAGLIDAVPINTTSVLLGDNMSVKSPHAMIEKARMTLAAGMKPQKIRGAGVEFVALQDAVRSVTGVRTYQIVLRKEALDDPTSRDLLEVHLAVGDGVDRRSVGKSCARR